MATPKATDPSFKSESPENEDFDFQDTKCEDSGTEDPKPDDSDIKCEDMGEEGPKIDDPNIERLKSEDEETEDLKLDTAALPTMPSLPIPVTSPHWKTTLENLLRFPGMRPRRLFRPGNPIAEIALALGVTDSDYSIIESSWVPIAERVFEIQTCCLMNAGNITFYTAPDGWITWDITTEWCAQVLHDLQGKGFRTTCTAVVGFVARVYLQTGSWIRFQYPRGKRSHRQIMNSLRPDPRAHQVIATCSQVAGGFTSVVKQARKRAIERAEQGNEGI